MDIFSRILLPTDLTSESSHLAAWLAGTKGLGVEEAVLLNVVELGPQIGFAADGFERMVAWKRDAEEGLRELREQVDATGIRCRYRLELGKPSLEILRVAEEERVALIAMGGHARGLLRRILRRSVTGAVVDGAACPVLIVPVARGKRLQGGSGTPLRPLFRRVILATDFSDAAGGALALVKHLPTGEANDVVVLHVGDRTRVGQSAREESLQQRLKRVAGELAFFGITVTCVAQEGRPASTIARISRERDASLIVIGSGARRSSDGSLGSVACAVLRASNRPVLAVPPVGA